MDSITHIALGACIGEIILGPKAGRKALLWGAIAQSFPDIDILGSLFLSPDAALLIHRGITHSIFFGVIVAPLFALVFKKTNSNIAVSFLSLVLFFLLQMLVHDLLDICNAYGTGIFEPFSHHRFSINLLYVADPLFTIWLLIAVFMLCFRTIKYKRWKIAVSCLLLSFTYLGLSAVNKIKAERKAQRAFAYNHIDPDRFLITPTPFNNLLWYIIAAKGNNYYTGYVSVFDKNSLQVPLIQFSKNDSLLKQYPDNHTLRNLLIYAQNYYTVEQKSNSVVFNVLRFGQVQGWSDLHAPFVFHYFLNPDSSNTLVVQRSRFQGWTTRNALEMMKRIAGKQIDTNYYQHLK